MYILSKFDLKQNCYTKLWIFLRPLALQISFIKTQIESLQVKSTSVDLMTFKTCLDHLFLFEDRKFIYISQVTQLLLIRDFSQKNKPTKVCF